MQANLCLDMCKQILLSSSFFINRRQGVSCCTRTAHGAIYQSMADQMQICCERTRDSPASEQASKTLR